ncbi:MAG: S-adenosylmethionine:tRNA ribosyltransferase-isomerase [Candidatus Dormibacteraeota bacterium]|uniref:S-adenosylmethionine:tRNA ribosyltransferase-isomerase n=1 Tax=Candidatus Amunia macphersoniae TaxID=3127014 RepID=A0A934KIM2_9BACT|nr:S-adenosylmethionine:tRNA ribosyltransferase-isomerase [Candidatus Dormibacteraeota bacterium]
MPLAVQRPAARFTIPPGAEADSPPERRGVARDGVRLLVARPAGIEHRRFYDLPRLLDPGDLVVINTSATLPAALDGRLDNGRDAPVHVSTALDDGTWVVEVRRPDGTGPDLDVRRGSTMLLPDALELRLEEAYPNPDASRPRLWHATPARHVLLVDFLARHGRPIEYSHLRARHPLSDHQNIYATQPGSAEMASAGRPFTAPLLVSLIAAGVTVAPVVLHGAVASPELHEPPLPERFEVPAATARLVSSAARAGSRVVAVGTTVVRALESAASASGEVRAARGWTDLVLGPHRSARVVDGLLTGLHAPEASHLLLLEAVAGSRLVADAYDAAVDGRYLWHEFGDSMLILPERSGGMVS